MEKETEEPEGINYIEDDGIDYETPFCMGCNYYNKECAMEQLTRLPFDDELLPYFPTTPLDAESIEEFRLPEIKALPIPELPKFMFSNSATGNYEDDFIMIPLSRFKTNGKKVTSDIHKNREGMTVGLFMSDKDEPLLDFLEREDWADIIKAKNFDFVISPTVSFYFNQPSCATVYNRLLAYKCISELINKGVPVVPTINFLWEQDIKQYATWINNCGFKYVHYQMQMARKELNFKQSLELLHTAFLYLGSDIKIILSGVNKIERIKFLEDEVFSFNYINGQLGVLSQRRMVWKEDGNHEFSEKMDNLYKDVLFNKNVKSFKNALKNAGVNP